MLDKEGMTERIHNIVLWKVRIVRCGIWIWVESRCLFCTDIYKILDTIRTIETVKNIREENIFFVVELKTFFFLKIWNMNIAIFKLWDEIRTRPMRKRVTNNNNNKIILRSITWSNFMKWLTYPSKKNIWGCLRSWKFVPWVHWWYQFC